jgi:hypothetical protein
LQRVRYRWVIQRLSVTGFMSLAVAWVGVRRHPLAAPASRPRPRQVRTSRLAAFRPTPSIEYEPGDVYFGLTVGWTGETPTNTYLRNIGVQFTINDIFDKARRSVARATTAHPRFDNSSPICKGLHPYPHQDLVATREHPKVRPIRRGSFSGKCGNWIRHRNAGAPGIYGKTGRE